MTSEARYTEYSEESDYDHQEDCRESKKSDNTTEPMMPEISLSSIISSLNFQDFTFTISDALRYSVLVLGVLIVLLYLFPNHIVLLLLSLVLIVILIIGVALKRITGFASIPQTDLKFMKNKPINKEKLQKLRAALGHLKK